MRLLTRWLNGNATLAAGLLTFSWMVLVAVPLVWLGFNIADQIRDANAAARPAGRRVAACAGMAR